MKLPIVRVLGATTLIQAIVTMAALLPSAVAPDLASALAVQTAFIGFQISLVYGAAMITSVIGGTLVRRWGAVRVSQVSLACCGAGMGIAPLESIAILAVASILVGFGYGLINPGSSHLLEKCATSRNRNLLFSIKQTGVPLGGIAAGLIGPSLSVAFSWTWAFAAAGAASLALAVLLQTVRHDWDADRDPLTPLGASPLQDLRLALQMPVLRNLSLSALCLAALQLCLTSFLVALLVEDLAFGLVAAGVVLSAVQGAGFAGRIFWGWVADRLSDGLGVLAGLTVLMAVGAVATASLSPDSEAALINGILIVFGFTAIGWNGVYLAEVARAAPPGRIGSATGGSLVFTFGGVLAGPSAFALVCGALGSFVTAFALLSSVAFAGLVFVMLARRAAARG